MGTAGRVLKHNHLSSSVMMLRMAGSVPPFIYIRTDMSITRRQKPQLGKLAQIKSNHFRNRCDPMHCRQGKEFYKEMATTRTIFSLNIGDTETHAFVLGRQVTLSLISRHLTVATLSLTAFTFRQGMGLSE